VNNYSLRGLFLKFATESSQSLSAYGGYTHATIAKRLTSLFISTELCLLRINTGVKTQSQ